MRVCCVCVCVCVVCACEGCACVCVCVCVCVCEGDVCVHVYIYMYVCNLTCQLARLRLLPKAQTMKAPDTHGGKTTSVSAVQSANAQFCFLPICLATALGRVSEVRAVHS